VGKARTGKDCSGGSEADCVGKVESDVAGKAMAGGDGSCCPDASCVAAGTDRVGCGKEDEDGVALAIAFEVTLKQLV